MRQIIQWKTFRRDYIRQKRRGKRMEKLKQIVHMLTMYGTVDRHHHPHKLSGEWEGFWECHIEHDWLLIYDTNAHDVLLARTGTHTDLFE